MIDIHGGSSDPKEACLSNFTSRTFSFDGVVCKSIEGLLQSLKEPSPENQITICAMTGKKAKRHGAKLDSWKEAQVLWWQGTSYHRKSKEYQMLITRIYDAVFEQDTIFKDDLLAIGQEDICHSIGKSDPSDTVLTEVEMIYNLNRLRIKAMRVRSDALQPLPLDNIPKYRGIKVDGDPVEFLQSQYREWLAGKQLTQVILRRADEKLLNAVKYVLRLRKVKLASIVPPGIGK